MVQCNDAFHWYIKRRRAMINSVIHDQKNIALGLLQFCSESSTDNLTRDPHGYPHLLQRDPYLLQNKVLLFFSDALLFNFLISSPFFPPVPHSFISIIFTHDQIQSQWRAQHSHIRIYYTSFYTLHSLYFSRLPRKSTDKLF